jgi:RNA polymerase sigma factor (sigma-70 family)
VSHVALSAHGGYAFLRTLRNCTNSIRRRVEGRWSLRPNSVSLGLYRSHRESLISYAGRLSGDPGTAEDIVQDAWLLFDRRTGDEGIREPLAYLKRIVRNLVFAQVRKNRPDSTSHFDSNEAVRRLADDRPSAEAELIARDDMRFVMDVLRTLPDRQQAAFKLYYFEGLKLREVATRLGFSISLAHLLITEAMQICDERRKRATR